MFEMYLLWNFLEYEMSKECQDVQNTDIYIYIYPIGGDVFYVM
jgi:hypothetical protein